MHDQSYPAFRHLRPTFCCSDARSAQCNECSPPRTPLAKNRFGAIDHRVNALSQFSKPLQFRACAQDYVRRIAGIGYEVEKTLKFSYFGSAKDATCLHPRRPVRSSDVTLLELSYRSHLWSNELFCRQTRSGNPPSGSSAGANRFPRSTLISPNRTRPLRGGG